MRAPAGGAAAVGLAAALLAGCAAGSASSRAPLDDPAAAAARARRAAGPARPYRVRLAWEYTDERGPVEGDGVLRYNPTDSLRLDLFGPGGGNMSVALAGSGLRSVGQIQDVRLPPPAFLYASAGIFRPGHDAPRRGYRSDGAEVLVYAARGGGSLRFRFRDGRLQRVEALRDGRVLREADLEWRDGSAPWPSEAEYRDRTRASRARWRLEGARAAETPFPREIYDLPPARRP